MRGPAPVIIPDLVWDCATFGPADALHFVTATGGVIGQALAVAALAHAVVSPTPATHPDCDQLSSGGVCTDPSPRTVSVGGQTWATGPRPAQWISPTPQQVTTILDTCTTLVQEAQPSLTPQQARAKCETQPIFVPGGKPDWGREAAIHDLDVIVAHPNLVQLQYVSAANKKVAVPSRDWYRTGSVYLQPCTGHILKGAVECDEYPFYTSAEGGPAAYSTYGQGALRPIGFADNRREGNALNAMYHDSRCGMSSAVVSSSGTVLLPGSAYLVVPLPDVNVPSFYLCPQG